MSVAAHSVSFAVYGRERERGGGHVQCLQEELRIYMYLLALEGILKSRASLCA